MNGKIVKQHVFINDDEKSRASEIVKQLKGMSIREAQHFLSKVSEALIDSQMLWELYLKFLQIFWYILLLS